MIPLDQVQPSPTNPRKSFDQAALEELAASIKDKGVLQPVLVRPIPYCGKHTVHALHTNGPMYSIVAGERRYRAAKLAGLAAIPAVVRELTDTQVLEIQCVENLQRQDLDPLEEAAGYQQLVDRHGYTVEDLAAKLAKSKAYVYGRLKLSALPAKAREAMAEGKLPQSTAQLIARIPSEKLREQAAKEALTKNYWGDPPSYRQVKENIEERFMIELKQAPFAQADKDLLPEAGSCKDCPKRTGNNRTEFPDGRADVCTDPPCYERKVAAHRQRACANVRRSGVRILDDDEAETAFKTGIGGLGRSKWLDLAERVHPGDSHRGVDMQPVAHWLKGELDSERAYAMDRKGHGHYLVPRKKAMELIEAQAKDRADRKEAKKKAHVPRVPPDHKIRERAEEIFIHEIVEMGKANFDDLDILKHNGGPETSAAYQALALVAQVLAVDQSEFASSNWGQATWKLFMPGFFDLERHEQEKAVVAWTAKASPRELLSFLLALSAQLCILPHSHGETSAKVREMLLHDFTDAGWKNWQAVEAQARKELTNEMRTASQAAKNGKPRTKPDMTSPQRGKREAAKRRRLHPEEAAEESEEEPAGQCQLCGCTSSDCRNCVERTGEPCHWTSPRKDLCSACLPLLETDLGILYVGKPAAVQAEMEMLADACLRTVGQVLNLGGSIPLPKGITGQRAAELREEAMAWIKKQLAVGPMGVIETDLEKVLADESDADAQDYYAWEMTIARHDGTQETIIRVAKTEKQARRLALLRPLAREVLEVEGWTREQYHRVHGHKRAKT